MSTVRERVTMTQAQQERDVRQTTEAIYLTSRDLFHNPVN
jgi:hypothetical protein